MPLLVLVFTTCESEVTPSIEQQLLFWGLDVSKTFKDHPRVHPNDLRDFCNQLAVKDASTVLLVSAIGNPSNQPFLRCNLQAIPKLNRSQNLSDQKRTVLKQQKVKARNTLAINEFITAYRNNIYSLEHSQYTDLSGFLQQVNIVSSEPQYRNFDKAVFLYSDCQHDTGKGTKPVSIDLVDFPKVKFHTTGADNKQLFEQVSFQEYESPQAFFTNYLLTL